MFKAAAVLFAVFVGANASRVAQGSEAMQKMNAKGNSMIAKVIEMLGEEKDKIKADLGVEGKAMQEYMQWCDDTQTELSYGIKSSNAKLEELSAIITDNGAQITALDEEIAELGNEISGRQSEMDEAIAVRTKDHDIFLKAETEQVAAVEELEQMGVALKQQIAAFTATPAPVADGAEEGAALVQNSASPAASFDAFLQIDVKKKTSVEDEKRARFARMQKAMTLVVNSVYIDADSKKTLKSLEENTALVQEEPADAGGDNMAAQVAQNEANLAAFEGLKG